MALLLINPDSKEHQIEVPLASLPLTGGGANLTAGGVAQRDIWNRADLPPLPKGAASVKATVGALDSAFLRLSPASNS